MRVAVREPDGSLLLLEPREIYYIEAHRAGSRVRTARRALRRDPRSLSRWEEILAGRGFFRVHRSYLVNLDRVRRVRRRRGDRNDWEVKMDPPVNAILPMSRAARRAMDGLLGP